MVELGLLGLRGVLGDTGSLDDVRLDEDARILFDDGLRCAFPGDEGSAEAVRRDERFLVEGLRGDLCELGSSEAVRREDEARFFVEALRWVRGVREVVGSTEAVRLDLLIP